MLTLKVHIVTRGRVAYRARRCNRFKRVPDANGEKREDCLNSLKCRLAEHTLTPAFAANLFAMLTLAWLLAPLSVGYVGYCDANVARQPNQVTGVLSEQSNQLG